MKKLNNILKLANYFYELNSFTKLADEQIDNLFNEIETVSDNYELKADLTFLKVLFNVFSKNGNGFDELNQAILSINNAYVSSYEDEEEDLDDEYMIQMPEDISKLGEFLNVLRSKIRNMPKSNKSFTKDEVRDAKEAKSAILAAQFKDDVEEPEQEPAKEAFTDEEIDQENKEFLTKNLGFGAGQFDKVQGDAEERKSKQSYSMVFLNGGRDVIEALKAEKEDVLASKKYYGSIPKVNEFADSVVMFIDQLIPEVLKANDNPEVSDLKSELNALFSLQYSEPEYINGKKKRKKLNIPGLPEKIKVIKDKLNSKLVEFKDISKKKTLAKNKFNKLISQLKFQEFEYTDVANNYSNKSPLEIIKIKNLGQITALRTGRFSKFIEEKKLRLLIDKSINAILNNESNKINLLTESSIIKEFERANKMMEGRVLANSMSWKGTQSNDALVKEFEKLSNLFSVFFSSSGYGIKALAANIANDAAFDIMKNDESLAKFLEERIKLKESLKPQIVKLEELYKKYNTEEDITIKTKLNHEIIRVSVSIRDAGKKLITHKQYPFANAKNIDTPTMKSMLQFVVANNIAPYVEKMESVREQFARISTERNKSILRKVINAYEQGWFTSKFGEKKAEALQLINEFKALLEDLKSLLPYFSIEKILADSSEILNKLELIISMNYSGEDIVTSFLNLKEELRAFGIDKKKDLSPKLLELKQQNLDYLKELKSKSWVNIIPEKQFRTLIDNMFYAEPIDEDKIRSNMAEAKIMTDKRTLNPTYFWGGKHDKLFDVRRLVKLSNAISVFFSQSGYGLKVLASNIANDAFYKIMQDDQDLKDFMEQRQIIKNNLKKQIKTLESLQDQYNKSKDIKEKSILNIEIIGLTMKIRKVGFKLVTNKDFKFATRPKNLDSPYVKEILNKIIDKNIAPYISKMEEIRAKFARITETRDKTIFAKIIDAYRKGWFTEHVSKFGKETSAMLYELAGMLNDFESIDRYFALSKIIKQGREIVNDLRGLEDIYSKINKQAMSGMLKNLENFLDLSMEII